MKPCARNRRLLVWLSLGELEQNQAAAIRQHVRSCEGCRGYLEEISQVAQDLRTKEPTEAIETSAVFHQRVARAIRATGPRSPGELMAEYLRTALLDWRVAVPLVGAIVAALVILKPGMGQPPAARPTESVRHEAPGPIPKRDANMTAASYWMAADQSFEALDDLLTEQGRRQPPAGAVYTPSMAMLVDLPE